MRKELDPVRDSRHVGAFGDEPYTIVHEVGGVLATNLVLGRRREGTFGRDVPERIGVLTETDRGERRASEAFRVLPDPTAPGVLQFHYPVQLLAVDTIGIVDEPARVRERHGPRV